MLGGIIGARSKFALENRRIAPTARGQIELAWQTIGAVRQRADLSAELIHAIGGVEKDYFGEYGALRDAVFAAGIRRATAYSLGTGDTTRGHFGYAEIMPFLHGVIIRHKNRHCRRLDGVEGKHLDPSLR